MRHLLRKNLGRVTNSETMRLARHGLGARGVDLIERAGASGTVVGFPVYDAHGSMVATISRNGSCGFQMADRRSYDAWGLVESVWGRARTDSRSTLVTP